MAIMGKLQLGKQGITNNFISGLKNCFSTHEIIKISVLKSAGHEREKIKEYAEKILGSLGRNYTARVIGFIIIIKKWRKNKR